MNYTIIAYKENESYTDRWGDTISNPSEFEIFFTTDKEELIEQWANWEFSSKYDRLEILLNGVPDTYLNAEDYVLFETLERSKSNKCKALKHEKIQRVQRLLLRKLDKL